MRRLLAAGGLIAILFGSASGAAAGAPEDHAVAITAGSSHTCAVLADGTVRCWGDNWGFQLGDGTRISSSVPVAVTGISSAVAIAAGANHTCALLADGAIRCWGAGGYGQLGDGTWRGSSTVPVPVTGISTAVAIAAGWFHTCAVLADGAVRCWGSNDHGSGQLGDGTTASSNVPVPVTGISTTVAVAAGVHHTCAVLADGAVRC